MRQPRPHAPTPANRLVWLPFLTTIVIGCDANPMGGKTLFQINLEEVSGNNQTVAAGGAASAPLVVRAVDQNGTPHSGMIIEWRLSSGEGTLSAASSVTNASGQAQVVYTSGGSAGETTVSATLSASSSANASRQVPPVVFKVGVTAASNSLQIRSDRQTGVRNDS